ncbi:retropepsin-like aspartic protease family protein [Sphingomicrobium flavum]|uniref:retropepsin-like aspartic protease family protein n=1 Tax=Sphingomicrobium flavum TaxID=1229164 RepID=UPI0021ADCA4E|nr:TIGR02281 family clan AA aspartic protease [Sphingomicrobium flavum]
MTINWAAGGLLIIFAIFLLSGLIGGRRGEPLGKLAKMALSWVVIFAAVFVLFTFRDDFGYVFQRLQAEATGAPVELEDEIRIPMAVDGHFWIEADVNGMPVNFLVDSGATVTTLGASAAQAAGVEREAQANQLVETANGTVAVYRGRAQLLEAAGVRRENMRVHVAERDDMNVLGMNFLSSLDRWSVEGRWLILQP